MTSCYDDGMFPMGTSSKSNNETKLSTIDVTDCSPSKFDDSDVSSKRRKLVETDEYNTVFTKKLISEPDLNSTLDLENSSSSFIINKEDNLDYTGGLLSDYDETINISNKPADSSFGFQNTFEILEKQMIESKQLRLSRNQLESFVDSQKTDYLDIPFRPENFLRCISEEGSNFDEDEEKYDKPDLFELELEASKRIYEMFSTKNSNLADKSCDDLKSPLNELLYGIVPKFKEEETINFQTKLKETTTARDGEYPEYLYHIAKGKDGRLYLRVVRSMLVDKVLCGNRVSQMTRAYDDIEAVTRLLEEKEKDLELTVQIGKELLAQNNRLESRVTELTGELKTANENLAQLSHDLYQKNELVSILTNDYDDSGSENVTPTASKSINLDLLQKKISGLEDENRSLRQEAMQLVKETDECEEAERRLMADITSQLNSTNFEYDGMNLELERYKEENRLQHEQIVNLSQRLADTELRLHQLSTENDEQESLLGITQENQNLLASELSDFKERYQEVLSLLQETQEQLRKIRKRGQPTVRSSLIPGLSVPQVDSLQSELMETSLFSDNSLDSGIALERGGPGGSHIPGYKKVFDTVRCVSRTNNFSDGMSQLGAMSMSSSSQPRMSSYPYPSNNGSHYRGTSSVYSGSTYPSFESSMGGKSFSRESLTSDPDESYPAQTTQSGIPGAPGAKDLEAALKRLTPAEVLARRAMLQHAPAGTYSYDDAPTGIPFGFRTPDSIMSTGSSGLSGLSSHHWRLPEKLQIVKPMEGSQTLHHWNRLATPTLSGLLDDRPGVTIRGGRGLDELGLQMYSLSDVEEDAEEHPGKRFQQSGCVYTYTMSNIMHPDDGSSVTFSVPSSQMASRMTSECSSRQSSCPPTPRTGLSRRNSCSTFSVNLGLASMLYERGIKAVTPSALNTPCGPNFTPTGTPCNSPEGSPVRSMSPEPQFLSGLISTGADMLRRKLVGEAEKQQYRTRNKIVLSRLEKRALRSIKILDKIESIGLDNIMHSSSSSSNVSVSPLALQGSSTLYSCHSRTTSPMSQLHNFKQHMTETKKDDVRFDRDALKACLSKGFNSSDSLKSYSDDASDSSSNLSSADEPTPKKLIKKPPLPSNSGKSMGAPAEPGTGAIDARVKQMQRQKSRRSLMNGAGGQRPDLGRVGSVKSNVRPDLGKVASKQPEEKMGFVGTISSLLFGRKGGLL